MKLKSFYNAILNKNERNRIRITLIEVFGLSKVTISGWLCGSKTPPERYHNAIAEIFGVPVTELF